MGLSGYVTFLPLLHLRVSDILRMTCLLLTTVYCRLLIPSATIASSSSIDGQISQAFSKCPSHTYIIVSQPGVRTEDYQGRSSAPHLRRKLSSKDTRIRSCTSIHDVRGDIILESLSRQLEERCGAKHYWIDASSKSSSTISVDSKTLTGYPQKWGRLPFPKTVDR